MTTPTKSKHIRKELRMLSPVLPPVSDRDRMRRAQKKSISSEEPETTTASESTEAMSDPEAMLPPAATPYNLRARLLETEGGGDIAADLFANASESSKENQAPPPVHGNGRYSFEAIPPVNVLLPFDVLVSTFENVLICPNVSCSSKKIQNGVLDTDKTLQVEVEQYGLATEMFLSCRCCGFATAICPPSTQQKGDTPNSTPIKKRSNRDTEFFHRYGINYAAGFLMQKLGIGLRGLDMIMAFLGVAPNHGSDWKWNRLMNRIGLAEEEVSGEVLLSNLCNERKLTIEAVDEQMAAWMLLPEAENATPIQIQQKRNQLLMMDNGKIGITVSADGGWQKRSIGKGAYNSTTGHNFAVGGYSKKIVGIQCYSQHCRKCELSEKNHTVVRAHRCPRNFDINSSSKAMEAEGAVQHCIDTARSPANVYIAGLVTDDDSTTRSNVKHSLADQIERDHPGTKNAEGKIPGRLKRRLGWPVDAKNKLVNDPGRLPLDIPVPKKLLSDPQHRIRGIGNAFFDCKSSSAKKKNDNGLTKHECLNGKRNIGYYIKKNQHFSPGDFGRKASCVVLHLFNDHSECSADWCTKLQADSENNPNKRRKIDNQLKYRETATKAQKELLEKVKAKVLPLLSHDKMMEVYHNFHTQKNETLQRQATALAPKDRFFGGTMQLYDRLRLLTILDSLGEYGGMSRLFAALGLPPPHPVMSLWACNKDRADTRRHNYRQQPSIKRKRASDKIAQMKAGVLQDKKARSEGVTYESGIANEEADNVVSVDEDTNFDTFDSIDTTI